MYSAGVVWVDSRNEYYNIYYAPLAGGPIPPTIEGPSSGKINRNHDFTVTTTDPGNLDVQYFIDWGDGSDSGWLGPFDSGTGTTESHRWTEQADYNVRAKAKNSDGIESDWSTLTFSAPRNKAIYQNFLERFPILNNLFRILFL